MAKLSLDIEYDYDFLLIGISCHEKDYRICWAINKALGIELSKQADLEIKEKKQVEAAAYSLYTFSDLEHYIEYFVVANRSKSSLLIPEQKQADYLLKANGALGDGHKERIMTALRGIPIVLTSFEIKPESLKSKQNLLF